MAVTVRRRVHLDRWDTLAGDSRWVDYSHQQVGVELVVYAHTFRRVRERRDDRSDVLLWKPASTAVARRYAAGEWDEVVGAEKAWPPYELEVVPRRPRRRRDET